MAKPTFDPSAGFAVTPVDRGGLVIKPCPFCGSAPELTIKGDAIIADAHCAKPFKAGTP